MQELITDSHSATINDRLITYFRNFGMLKASVGLMGENVANSTYSINAVSFASSYESH